VNLTSGWAKDLDRWLEPFLDALGDKRRRQWTALYIIGLLLPGERKSMQPISQRVAPDEVEQIHHFVATSSWDTGPVESVLCRKADAMLGGNDSYAIVDDTALPKKDNHSVGVAHQYCGALGKQANCQYLVSVTLARAEVLPVAASQLTRTSARFMTCRRQSALRPATRIAPRRVASRAAEQAGGGAGGRGSPGEA
jgi:SRSO17 transposase